MKNEHYNQALQKEQDMKQLNDYNSNLQIQLNIQYLQCDDYDSLSPWVKPGFNSQPHVRNIIFDEQVWTKNP